MTIIFDATETFMRASGQLDVIGMPLDYNDPERELRRELAREEYREYRDGEVANNRAEIADGCADQIVIALGTMFKYFGPELTRLILDEVGNSNLSKVLEDGTVLKRSDGKVLKPEGYLAPRIAEIIEEWDEAHTVRPPEPRLVDPPLTDRERHQKTLREYLY